MRVGRLGYLWQEWGLNLALHEVVPWEVGEPRVVLDLFRAVGAQPIFRLSLDHLLGLVSEEEGYSVDEIKGFVRPSLRLSAWFYLHLLQQDLITDLSSTPSQIRSTPHHALICDYSKRVVINRNAVVLSAHDFRC